MVVMEPEYYDNKEDFLDKFIGEIRDEFEEINLTQRDYTHFFIKNYKTQYSLTWQDVADILNSVYLTAKSANAFRCSERSYIEPETLIPEDDTDKFTETLIEMKKLKTQLSDERIQANAYFRRVAREDTIKEIATDVANNLSSKILLPLPVKEGGKEAEVVINDREGLLLLSDWHYGIDINNHWNIYNPDIAKERIAKLLEETKKLCKQNDIKHLVVVNLGDLISGRIHNTIRLANRIDVITQTIEVSEILAEFLSSLSLDVPCITYYDTSDNHSRVEPNLSDSLDLESLTRIITEFLKLRLANNVNVHIHDNYYSDDIVNFTLAGHQCIGVHGHHDKPKKMIANLTLLTKDSYDLVVSAHLHHFNADEENGTIRVGNGSLMGTDDYSVNLRLNSAPSQTFIVATKDNVVTSIHKIDLN